MKKIIKLTFLLSLVFVSHSFAMDKSAQNEAQEIAAIEAIEGKAGQADSDEQTIAKRPKVKAVKKSVARNYDDQGYAQIHRAILAQNIPLVETLLEKNKEQANWQVKNPDTKADREDEYNSLKPLHLAVKLDDSKMAQTLINFGAAINATDDTGATALCYAVEAGQAAMAALLLTAKADPNLVFDTSPLLIQACEQENLDMVMSLVRAKADLTAVDDDGFNPLHRAVLEGNKNIVQYLIDAGANIDSRIDQEDDYDQATALLLAASKGYRDIIELLCDKYHADINIPTSLGFTPLLEAIDELKNKDQAEKTAALLIDKGADATKQIPDNDPRNPLATALHLAVRKNMADTVLKLLKKADAAHIVNIQDNAGNTALHDAARLGYKNIVLHLLQYDADTTKTNTLGLTPAQVTQDKKIAEIICKHTAKKEQNYSSCSVCNEKKKELSNCGRCKTGSYCSPKCQKADWKEHKKTCKPTVQKVDRTASPQAKESSKPASPAPSASASPAASNGPLNQKDPVEEMRQQREREEQERQRQAGARADKLIGALVTWDTHQTTANRDAVKLLLEGKPAAKLLTLPARDDSRFEPILERVMKTLYSGQTVATRSTSSSNSSPQKIKKQNSGKKAGRASHSPKHNKQKNKPAQFSSQKPQHAVHVSASPRDLPPMDAPTPQYLVEAMKEHALRDDMPALEFSSSTSSSSSSSCSSSSSSSYEVKSSGPQETLYGHLLSIAVSAADNRQRNQAFAAHHATAHAFHSPAGPESSHTHDDVPEKPAGSDRIFWDHIFVGNAQGGLHHDENKTLEKDKKVSSTGEHIDGFGSYRARVTQSNKVNSFFPSNWSVNEVKDVIGRAAANIDEWSFDPEGNQVGVARVFPPLLYRHGTAKITVELVFRGTSSDVITAYPIK